MTLPPVPSHFTHAHISNPASTSGPFFIEIMNGKDKGARFQMVSQKISIGRSQGNDIVLNDLRVSRQHATLQATPQGLQIIRINKDRKVMVGKKEIFNAILELPSVVLIGKTKLKITQQSQLPTLASPSALSKDSSKSSVDDFQMGTQGQSKKKFYTIVGCVAVVLFLLLSENKKEEEVSHLITEEEQERHISSIEEKSTAIHREFQQTGRNTPQYREAKALFIQGLRDYRERNYVRAMDYFSGALALFPNHTLSQRYLQQSKTKQDQLIQHKLLESNKYYEHKQYRQAAASYEQILVLIGDKNNKIYREAQGRLEECRAIMQRYL